MALTNRGVGPVLAVALVLAGRPALAAGETHAGDVQPTTWEESSQVHTMAELSAGLIAAPRASICSPTEVSCFRSESTLLLTFRQLIQFSRRFALGASIAWGIRPLNDTVSQQSDAGTIARTHKRNYFDLGPVLRGYPYLGDHVSVWLGGGFGLIIVDDAYTPKDDGTSAVVVGPTATTVRTEGLSLAGGVGVEYHLSPQWSVGLWTMENSWFLPKTRACAPTNECATVTGTVVTIESGLSVTYRVRL